MLSCRTILSFAVLLLATAPVAQGGSALLNPASQGPIATFHPPRFNFGTVKQGTVLKGTTVLTNTGNETLILSSIVTSGQGLTESNTCGTSLAPGASCSTSFKWDPHLGTNTASFVFYDNAPNSPQVITLKVIVVP